MGKAAHILLDWGTTNLRAYLVDADGVVLARRTAQGILHVPNKDFAGAFTAAVGPWRAEAPALPALMSGMIGSRQGWAEAPYVSCPASLEEIAGAVIKVPNVTAVRIIPGVRLTAGKRDHDIMRGEEVQVFGALDLINEATGRHTLCLPGTHSKWVIVERSRIVWLATFMTGELFAVLRDHSILGRLMTARSGTEAKLQGAKAFRAGFARSNDIGGLLHHLFSVRTQNLFGAIHGADLGSYLSGLLLGHEIRGMSELVPPGRAIIVVGPSMVRDLYAEALREFGWAPMLVDGEDATVRGMGLVQAAMAQGP